MERRWNDRQDKELDISFNYNDTEINGKTINISLGGMFIHITPGISAIPHKPFTASILDNGKLIRCMLELVRNDKTGIGVQFQDYSHELLRLLNQKLFCSYETKHSATKAV